MPLLFVRHSVSASLFRLGFAANTAVVLFSLLRILQMRVSRSRGCQLCTDFLLVRVKHKRLKSVLLKVLIWYPYIPYQAILDRLGNMAGSLLGRLPSCPSLDPQVHILSSSIYYRVDLSTCFCCIEYDRNDAMPHWRLVAPGFPPCLALYFL